MNLKVNFKVNPIVAMLFIAGVLVLCFVVFRGCKQSHIEVAEKEKAIKLADSALSELARFKSVSDSSKLDYEMKTELLSGQIDLLENQKNAREDALNKVLDENKAAISKHRDNFHDFVIKDDGIIRHWSWTMGDGNVKRDTISVTVPNEYVNECEDCFTKLEVTTGLTLKYKSDYTSLYNKMRLQRSSDSSRIRQLESDGKVFYNKIQSLTIQAKEATDKLKPHGRLYLSWGVLWNPWPMAGGAGLMYQTKYNFQYGAKYYYSNNGGIVETSMYFPLSLKF